MTVHHLKLLTNYYSHSLNNAKTFEIRENDRNFQVGDVVLLEEWDEHAQQYTGRSHYKRITYITDFKQRDNYVVMAVAPTSCLPEDHTPVTV